MTGSECNPVLVGGPELNRKADALASVLSLKNAEVQVWPAGESGVAGERDEISFMDEITFADFDAAFLQMAIIADGSIS